MTLNKTCSCGVKITTKNSHRISTHNNRMKRRTEMGLWINCKKCESTMLFLSKKTKQMMQEDNVDNSYSVVKSAFNSVFGKE
jgi:hypothetical protein